MIARWATAEDRAAVRALLEQALKEVTPGRGGTRFAAEQAQLLAKLSSSPAEAVDGAEYKLAVACARDAVVGAAIGRRVLDGDGESRCVLEAFYVDPGWRRKGAGRSMLALVEGWAARERLGGIDVSALPGDRATKSFLEQAGFRARLLVMHKPLS